MGVLRSIRRAAARRAEWLGRFAVTADGSEATPARATRDPRRASRDYRMESLERRVLLSGTPFDGAAAIDSGIAAWVALTDGFMPTMIDDPNSDEPEDMIFSGGLAAFASKFPIIGEALTDGSFFDFGNLNQVLTSVNAVDFTTEAEYVAELQAQLISVNASGVAVSFNAGVFSVDFERTVMDTLPIEIGVDEFGISFEAMGTFELSAMLDVSLVFDAIGGDFQVHTDTSSVGVDLLVDSSPIDASGELGFVDVDLEDVLLDLAIGIDVNLLGGADGNDRATTSEIQGDDLSDLASLAVSGTASVELPTVTVTLDGMPVAGAPSGGVRFQWSDVTELSSVDFDPNFGNADLLNFANTSAVDIFNGLAGLSNALISADGFGASGIDLPLIGGDIADYVTFGDQLATELIKLGDELFVNDGNADPGEQTGETLPSLTEFLNLSANLGGLQISLALDSITTEEITFKLTGSKTDLFPMVDPVTDELTWVDSLAFEAGGLLDFFDIGDENGLNFDIDATLPFLITGMAGFDFTFGVNIKSKEDLAGDLGVMDLDDVDGDMIANDMDPDADGDGLTDATVDLDDDQDGNLDVLQLGPNGEHTTEFKWKTPVFAVADGLSAQQKIDMAVTDFTAKLDQAVIDAITADSMAEEPQGLVGLNAETRTAMIDYARDAVSFTDGGGGINYIGGGINAFKALDGNVDVTDIVPLTRRFFVNEDSSLISLELELRSDQDGDAATTDDNQFNIGASLGFLALDVAGNVSIAPSFSVTVADPTDSGGFDDDRLDLAELNEVFSSHESDPNNEGDLFDRFDAVLDVNVGGTVESFLDLTTNLPTPGPLQVGIVGNLTALDNPFPFMETAPGSGEWDPAGNIFEFETSLEDLPMDPESDDFIHIATNLDDLTNLQNLSPSQIIDMIAQGAQMLAEFADIDLLAQEIPIVGVSVEDAIDFAGEFGDLVQGLEERDPDDTSEFNDALNEVLGQLGIPTENIMLEVTADDFRVTFEFSPEIDPLSLPFDFDLGEDLVLVSADGAGSLTVTPEMALQLTFGILFEPTDLDSSGEIEFGERVFLGNDSSFNFSTMVDAGVNTTVTVGPLNADITGTIDLNGAFSLGLGQNLGADYTTFAEILDDVSNAFSAEVTGYIGADFEISNALLGDAQVVVRGDLRALDNGGASDIFDFTQDVEDIDDEFGKTNVPDDIIYVANDINFTGLSFSDLDLGTLVDGFVTTATWIGDGLIASDALNIDLPLLGTITDDLVSIGEDILDVAMDVDAFWTEVQENQDMFVSGLETRIEDAIGTFFGSAGLMPEVNAEVTEFDGSAFDIATSNSIAVSIAITQPDLVDIEEELDASFGFGPAFELDFGDPAVEGDGIGLDFQLGYALRLAFGIGVDEGVFFGEAIKPQEIADDDDDGQADYTQAEWDAIWDGDLFELTVSASEFDLDPNDGLDGFQGSAMLFGLIQIDVDEGEFGLHAVGNDNAPARLFVDVKGSLGDPDPGGSPGLLTLSDILNENNELTDLVDVGIDLEVEMMLPITTSITLDLLGSDLGAVSGAFPTISADIVFRWSVQESFFDAGDSDENGTSSFGDVYFAVENAALDLGEFANALVRPVLELINEFNPFKEFEFISDALNEDIPLIDTDVRGMIGELVSTFGSQQDQVLWQVFLFLVDLDDTLANWDPNGEDFSLSMGSFVIVDTSDGVAGSTMGHDGNGGSDDPSSLPGIGAIFDFFDVAGTPLIEFPILTDPVTIFNLLLGEGITGDTGTFIQFNPPPLTLGYSINFERTLFDLDIGFLEGSLAVGLNGWLGLTARIGLGFDSRGFAPGGEWWHGFYMVDFYNETTGADIAEISLGGGIDAWVDGKFGIDVAGIDVASVKFKGSGGANVSAGFDLNDEAITIAEEDRGDGRFHLDEIERVWLTHGDNPGNLASNPTGFLCLFNVIADISAYLEFSGKAKVLGITVFNETFSEEWVILRETLMCEPTVRLADDSLDVTGDGIKDLVLLMGPEADERFDGVGDVDEDFVVTYLGGNNYRVQAFDFSLDYKLDAGGRIIADGGLGNDSVLIEAGAPNDAILKGGTGDDTLIYSGSGTAMLYGDNGVVGGPDGNDSLVGGALGDTIRGGGGNDTIRGNGGADLLIGQLGADSIFGGAGGDTIQGNEGDDTVDGGAGADDIDGGDGDDSLLGGAGNDTIVGMAGADVLRGGTDADDLRGGDGADSIFGDAGDDLLFGGMGDDQLDGGADDDDLFGEAGDDELQGATGDDSLEGGTGNDTLGGGDGDDTLLGELGDDVARGDGGSDIIEGNDGMDSLFGGAGDDTVDGGNHDDFVIGGSLTGIDGADVLRGGLGNDLLIGDNGSVSGTFGAFTAMTRGQSAGGNDTIQGEEGDDTLFGGRADDALYGALETGAVTGTDNDLIFGDGGEVIVAGGLTQRAFTRDEGGEGNDTLIGEMGDDVMLGGLGADEMSGGSGADVALGDRGAVDYDLDGDDSDLDRITDELSEMQTLAASGGQFEEVGGVLVGGQNSGPDPLDGDTITGGIGDDILVGGIDGDLVQGEIGEDLLFGDSAEIALVDGEVTLAESVDPTEGGTDQVEGGEDRDTILGGGLGDTLDGASGDDLIFGDSGRVDRTQPIETSFESIHMLTSDLGGSDFITAGSGEDTVVGGQANDEIYGGADDDDLIGGHNRAGGHDGISKKGNDSIFGEGGQDVIVGDNADVVRRTGSLSARFRVLETGELWDEMLEANVDAADHDDLSGFTRRDITLLDHNESSESVLFGNDLIVGGDDEDMIFGQRGDDTLRGDSAVAPAGGGSSLEGADDYIEGGGDSDLIYGDGGQDDLIGGSSEFFGLTTAADRPDGSDTIFGGAGLDAARNEFSDGDHGADADVILGDNGNIYRIVGLNGVDDGEYLSFAYDDYAGSERAIVRAFDELDYTPGASGAPSNGDGDEIHGEAGNDTILGMTGSDVLFGDAQDDDVYGGADSDWVSGGTGEDGVLGDDGRIFTSRNGLAEDLYDIDPTQQFFKETRPDHRLQNLFFVDAELRKTVDLEPFDEGGDDTIYGGLGGDSLHAGAGDDLVSGAEALEGFFVDPQSTPDHDYVTVADPNSQDNKFADYDYTALREKIDGHALNFNAAEGMESGEGDGDDAIFGDAGNDWLMGGTGSDHLYGGAGNDFLNMDDNLETDGGNNNLPDSGEYHIGDTGFGGGGVDTLTGASCDDRLVDSVGVHNLYVVPFFNVDGPVVTHGPLPPEISDFLLLLGWQDGADQTRFDANDPAAALRRGEPDGELNLILPGDPEFGGEVTPVFSDLPGNIPGQDCDGHPTAGPEDGFAGDDDEDAHARTSGQGSAGGGPLPGPGGGGGNPGGGNPGGPGTGPQPGPGGAPEPTDTPAGSEPTRQGAPAPFEVRFAPDAQRGVRVTVESAPDARPGRIEAAPALEPALGAMAELPVDLQGVSMVDGASLMLGDIAGFGEGASLEASAPPIEFIEVDLDAPAPLQSGPVEPAQWQEVEVPAPDSEVVATAAVAVSWSDTPEVALESGSASSVRVNWRGFGRLGRGGL